MTEQLEIQKSRRYIEPQIHPYLRAWLGIGKGKKAVFFFRLPDALSVSSQATASWVDKALLNARSLTWLFYRFVSHFKIFPPLDHY